MVHWLLCNMDIVKEPHNAFIANQELICCSFFNNVFPIPVIESTVGMSL